MTGCALHPSQQKDGTYGQGSGDGCGEPQEPFRREGVVGQ